ncbi:MAG: peptidyl-alpha-hydroxyglycine alpha-amidating lyase family protein [Chloroflexota bacterium]|nr:peptidyl-alpha-hydroxyglycine alpha-amidating lyase family protein [Chloroflexota bacterium]MEC9450853.1 peptidyl-alpha-hydroxyglycine alpha-amidating lyase family protein [Chloroflexota bacterium]|tara:strand:- start:2097 stop:3038 length:942 start_codon:yes stop_codon:yes gene_type:complete
MTHKINSNYSPVPNWCKLPYGMTFKNDATSVAVDSKDNVYVFCRGPVPLFIFDSEGNYINSWGEGEFLRPHGICVDKNDDLYLIDDQGHMIEKRTKEGKLIFRLGEKGKSSVRQSGDIFNLPTDAIVDPDTGDIFISDGYGNSRVHKFDTEGKYIKSWGEPGSDPGKFSLPHNIAITSDKRLIVADRENFRLQIFDTEGNFIDQWHIHHPMSVTTDKEDNIYVGEMGPPPVQEGVKNLGNCVSILNPEGKLIERLGDELPGSNDNQFVAPHGIAVDSKGSIYVAEVAWTFWFSRQENPPIGEIPSLRKWQRNA